MKRIKQTTLHYQDNRSDKIYEVELLLAGDNGYIVNFRYGRRGANLKEGTKTPNPVSLPEAEKFFDKLVKEKTKKGYQDITATAEPSTMSQTAATGEPISRDDRILSYLQGTPPEDWPLDRIIWRAGELKLSAATPHLINLLGTGEPLRDYCIAHALGQLGNAEALPILKQLEENTLTPEFVKRIAFEAMWKLGDATTREELEKIACDRLPTILQEAIATGNPETLTKTLQTYLDTKDYQPFQVLQTLYQTHLDIARPALHQFISTAPLAPPNFKPLRHLFKMAEYRHDAEFFGLLAWRFETGKALYNSKGYYMRMPDGRYLTFYEHRYNKETRRYELVADNLRNEQQRPDTSLAYSQDTRDYLRRRVWRTLAKLGEQGDLKYADLAVGVLLAYSDEDAQPVREKASYRWTSGGKYVALKSYWDQYAGYLSFNPILYSNSPRYHWQYGYQAWKCKDDYKPGAPPPEAREEAFPELWNQRPDALVELLLNSQCHRVHQFAVKALKDNPDFCQQMAVQDLVGLLSQPYDETTQFAFNLAKQRYTPENPNFDLVIALLNCSFAPARKQAQEWIDTNTNTFIGSAEFLCQLLLSPHLEIQEFARKLLRSHPIPENRSKIIIGYIISELISTTESEPVEAISDTLLQLFATPLQTLSLQVILDLLQHPVPEVQTLGARLLHNHETPATELPVSIIESLIASTQEAIRSIGVEIFGQLGDRQLRESYRDAIIAMAVSAIPDLRQSVQPLIYRLANGHPDFSLPLATELIEFLLIPEPHDGVHKDLFSLIHLHLPGWKGEISQELNLRLLKSKFGYAQQLSGINLKVSVYRWAKQWSIAEIVRLASHEVLSVRQASWTMIEHNIDRIKASNAEKLAAVRLLEAKWEDSRQFAQELFQRHFTDTDWTPEVMVLICDSIREDVREFGRQLVTRTFEEPYGQDYLLQFSEHPSTDMQAFASQYLQNYAADNPEQLAELKPYLITVLSQVNRGRVAKQKVFSFLEQEALKSEAAAQIIAEVLTRQSATMAIADKSHCLQLMLRLHQHYPHIPLPIEVKPVAEIRR
ncbi:WGR domain-containing protein [Roseofilum sp. Belize Diploria]|uniref:WGR domain-containing protein n=1 Tax=Roseofilum sp. Belize Diploria TaxID=2821501 RepID=UPI001B0804FE|nr:WGR domain-containing protein [Roseofilum sp. Belize Diploria]MBP0009148.1 WGR domain-containing protein [Roseofilum sp. Belize Diploria]